VAIASADAAPPFRRSWIFQSDGRLIVFPGSIDAEIAEFLRLDLALDTILRELEAEADPAASLDRLGAVRQPVLQLLGSESLPVFRDATVALEDEGQWTDRDGRRRVDAGGAGQQRALGGGTGPLQTTADCRGVRDTHAGRRLQRRPVR
jgi:hypothetical protein